MKSAPAVEDLRIAVSGHRDLSNLDQIARWIDQALERIAQDYPGRAWIVLSALAEGADQLVVERILLKQPAARLQVPLPMPEAAYLKDFIKPTGRPDFQRLHALAQQTVEMPAAPTPEEAYTLLGRYLTSHSNLLIAVWDGRPARGPGGTGDIVQMARQANLPLAWIHAQNTPSASITFERFPTSMVET